MWRGKDLGDVGYIKFTPWRNSRVTMKEVEDVRPATIVFKGESELQTSGESFILLFLTPPRVHMQLIR